MGPDRARPGQARAGELLEKHKPELRGKLLAVETTAHPTDGELLDHARRLFKRLDRLQPNSPPFGSKS